MVRKVFSIIICIFIFATINTGCTKEEPSETQESTTSQEQETTQESLSVNDEITQEHGTTVVAGTTKSAATKPSTTVDTVNSKPTITKRPATTTTTRPPTTLPYVVDTKTETSTFTTLLKYGVIQIETTETVYEIYNEGSRKIKSTGVTATYDRSGYTASTGDIIDDATENRNTYRAEINAIYENVNRYRAEAGVDPIMLDEVLTKAAMVRACEMAWSGVYSHTRPNGTKCFTIFDEFGFPDCAGGENIAMKYGNAQSVSEGWKNSSGHYKNMIDDTYSKIGIGVAADQQGCLYWCQEFIG